MKKISQWAAALLLFVTLNAKLGNAHGQGTAFTYQGRLNSSGSAVSGSYDLVFTLYTTNTTGSAVAGPVTNAAVAVTNGLFTTSVDFGTGVFVGTNNWLEIAVSTNAANTYSTLVPRQQLTPVPYAVTAASLSGTISPASISGTIPLAQLPPVLVTNNATAVTLSGNLFGNFGGTFFGNGGGLTGLNASALANGTVPMAQLPAANIWQTGGNNVSPGQFLGSTNNQPVEIWAANGRVLRLEQGNAGAPNVIGGAAVNFVASGHGAATIGGGGYVGSNTNSVTNDYGTVGGGAGNTAAFVSVVGGGAFNTSGNNYSTIAGGRANSAFGIGSFIGGGGVDGNTTAGNTNYGNAAVIVGGLNNLIAVGGNYSAIGGGSGNVISNSSPYSVIGGGVDNVVYGDINSFGNVVIAGGYNNVINSNSWNSVIGGGVGNVVGVNADHAVIGGGLNNTNSGVYSFIGGGKQNQILGDIFIVAGVSTNYMGSSTIGGGNGNVIQTNAPYCVIGGGKANRIMGDPYDTASSVIGGGHANLISSYAYASVIGGGEGNTVVAGSEYSVIAGGFENYVAGFGSFIGGGGVDASNYGANTNVGTAAVIVGGFQNLVTSGGNYASLGGGLYNTVSGMAATIAGGSNNVASGRFSFAAGQQAQALHPGAFVWADSQNAPFASTTNDQFAVRAQGGVLLNAGTNNVEIASGGLKVTGAGIDTATTAFIHIATGTNTASDYTTISNPNCDNNPNAILLVTHNYSQDTNSTGKYETHAVGVFYNAPHWAIYHEDSSAMALGRAYNVLIIKP